MKNVVACGSQHQGIGASYFPGAGHTARPSTGCRGFYPGIFSSALGDL